MAPPAPIPVNESERLRVLRDYGILDTGPEVEFDDLTRLAAHICDTPIATITFVDATRQWFKSRIGLDNNGGPRDHAFCAHAILQPGLTEVHDAAEDARFANNPLVTGDPKIRFYAGAPLVAPAGEALGTICVIDRRPRTLTADQRTALAALSRLVMTQLEFRKHLDALHGATTGRARVEQERLDVQKMKQEFVSNVSHELRTPLTSIRGALTLLTSGALGALPDQQRELVEIAERNTVRLIALINDILDLERLEGGKIEMHLARVDVADVVKRAVEAVAAFADSQGVGIDVESIGCVIWADTDRIVQVLVNLVSNAVKFSPPGSRVRIVDVPRGAACEIQVQDRGRGISPAHRHAIFERFRQVDASDAKQKGGTGLGLAICRAIVEQHGGSIGVESDEGAGSNFWFRIPVAPGQHDSLHDGHRAVLLVEDDVIMLDLMARQLTSRGIPIRTATGGQEALRLSHEHVPALIVLDVDMPQGNGYALVDELRKVPALAAVPVLVYTGLDLTANERGRLQLGPTHFLTKSKATSDDFHTVINDLLGATP